MAQTNTELAESLHQFVTVWKMIGRPFPHVDQMDRPGLAITWPATDFPFYNALFLTEQLAGYPLYLRLGYHPTMKFMGCMLGS